VTATDEARETALVAAQAAADKLATDIVLIDVSERLAITDVFVVATGGNERQVEAIVDEVEEKLRLHGVKPIRREGRRDGRWVLLDYGDIVVHVFLDEIRRFYDIERLYRDVPVIDWRTVGAGGRAELSRGRAEGPGRGDRVLSRPLLRIRRRRGADHAEAWP